MTFSMLDESILKELDHFNFKGNEISVIMNKLNNTKIKNLFLSFLIENRGKVINLVLVLKELKKVVAKDHI